MALDKITTAIIADDAVTAAKIPAGAVGTTEIAASAVTAAKVAADVATQAELDASGIDGITSTGATASDTITITGNLKVKGAFMKTIHQSWVLGG